MLRRSMLVASLSLLTLSAFAFAGAKKAKHAAAPDAAAAQAADTSSLEGKAAPDWTLTTLADGKDVKLSALKGDVVLVDYWATWCPPCRKSLPHVNEIANDADLKSKGLKVFAINCKETKDKAAKFVKDNKYSFPVLLDPQGTFGKEYLVQGIPTSVIVGRDGNIKKVFIGFEEGMEAQLKTAIEEALKDGAPTKAS